MMTSVGIEPTNAGCAPSTDAYVGSTTTEVKNIYMDCLHCG